MKTPVLQNVDNTNTSVSNSVYVRYCVAVLGAWTAEAVTYPFDLTKTRLQIQSEVATAKQGYKLENHGMIATAVGIAKNEGLFQLWGGLTPMLQRHAVYSGLRLVFYEKFRDIFKDETGHLSLTAASVGALPNVQRAALVNVGDLAAYDFSKRCLQRKFDVADNIGLHVAAATIAGLVAAILGTPADVLKTRLMNQPVRPDGRGKLYRGMIDCMQQSITNEGILSMYKGFMPLWLRLGPWALVYWVAFERIMIAIGRRTF